MIALFFIGCGQSEIVPAPPAPVWQSPPAQLTSSRDQFQTWPPYSRLHTASEGVNLRAGPDTAAAVVREIPMGTQLSLLGPTGNPVSIEGRDNQWYRVSYEDGEATLGGFVFGGALTPIAIPTADGLLVGTFSPDLQPRLRLQHRDGTTARDLGEPTGGGTLTVTVAMGLALVELCNGDCTSWNVQLDANLSEFPSERASIGTREAL